MNSFLDQLLLCALLLLSFCAFLSSAVVCEDQSVLHGIWSSESTHSCVCALREWPTIHTLWVTVHVNISYHTMHMLSYLARSPDKFFWCLNMVSYVVLVIVAYSLQVSCISLSSKSHPLVLEKRVTNIVCLEWSPPTHTQCIWLIPLPPLHWPYITLW